MRVPLSWLRDYAPVTAPAAEVAAALVRAGLEVERVEPVGADTAGVVVGEVLGVRRVPGSDRLWLVDVDAGAEPTQVVCGASNYAVGDRVPVALPGAQLPGGLRIAERTVFGQVSHGMLCSGRELGLSDDHGGILVLSRDAADATTGTDLVEALGLRDEVLDIAVTPDRGYCLSVRGVAREVATAFGVPFADPALVDVPPAGEGHPVRIDDPSGCSRYVARTVRDVDPQAPSPLWLRRRLSLAGMRPLSLAVDVTNHVLLGLGQPLHAFDLDRLSGPIVVRRAAAGERLVTLDGTARTLDAEDLVIADDSGPVALAGVMGGSSTEVGPGTRRVLVESAHFAPVSVARTARRHRLGSEAAKRFERDVDPELAPRAAQVAVDLLALLGGGTADPAATDAGAPPERPVLRLAMSLPGQLAGRDYPPAVVRRRLEQVGCAVDDGDPATVVPPSWRPDLVGDPELVEEVLRLEGYDTVPATLPRTPPSRGLTPAQRARRRVGRALAGAGFVEATSYPFIGETVLDRLGIGDADPRRQVLRLANPLSDEQAALRTTLLPGLLAALARNVSRGRADVALYETGAVFLPAPDTPTAPRLSADHRPAADELAALEAELPAQPGHVAVALCGLRALGGWWGPGRPADWADAVAAARAVAAATGAELEVRRGELPPWHPGRCAELVVAGSVVGYAGELHPRAVSALGLPERTCATELDLDAVLSAGVEVVPAPVVSPYPPAAVDMALVVTVDTPAAAVAEALRAGAGDLVEELRLFDVYTGPQVAAGYRSLAWSLRLRANDRTLTDEEVRAARDAAVAEASRRTGAVLRGT